jgi:methionyl-tRNA formyltransferase
VPALTALLGSHHRVVGVLTQPDRPKGRGRQLAASPVKELAVARGLPLAQPVRLSSEAERAAVTAWEPDVLVVVAYGLLVPRAVLGLPRLGCVNIHPSLLPRWRGAAPIQRTVMAGDPETGITIMLMDEGLDTGPILLQERTPLSPEETSGALHERLGPLGAVVLLNALDALAEGVLTPRPQPTLGVTYASKLEKAEAGIDWSRSALEICRQVHALNPWPVAETQLQGEQLRIFDARAESGPATATAEPGTIIATDPDVVVQCGEGRLALLSVQRPGRRVVTAAELARSRPLAGEHLG